MKTFRFKLPSAWLPIVMSALALAVVAGRLLISGATHEADEEAAAHLWQLLMAGQLPIIGWFLLKWVRQEPRRALPVLAVQVAAIAAAAAPVALLGL